MSDYDYDYESDTFYDDSDTQSTESTDLGPVDRFFVNFPRFDYCHDAPVNEEYVRLRWEEDWDRDESDEWYQEFRIALIEEFNNAFGMDEYDLESWQYLCTLLEVDPVPWDLEECQEIVLSTHVNLCDLLDTHRTGKQVKIFETEEELREYTVNTGKFFPLDEAKQGGVLRYLLRHILD